MNKLLTFIVALLLISEVTRGQPVPNSYHALQEKLARGWNTWSYGSMLSHVLLPEGLMVQMNIRQSFIGSPGDPTLLLDELAVDTTGLVIPIAHSFDGSYTELVIHNWKGNSIRVQSAASGQELCILVTPIERSPNIHYNLEMQMGMLWNRKGRVERRNDALIASIGKRTNVLHATSPLLAVYQPYPCPYLICKGDGAVGFYTGTLKDVTSVKAVISRAKNCYEMHAMKYGELAEAFKGIQTVLGWNSIYDPEQKRVITPVSRKWNKAWQGYVLFAWDTYFASFLFGLDNREWAYSNAIAVTRGLNAQGHIGHYQMAGRLTALGMSQPPVGSMVCWKLYEKFHDTWFVKEVYPNLLRWNRWWKDNRINRGYLSWGGWKGADLQIAKWESGLDNSPMYEGARMEPAGDHSVMNLADVGLNSLYTMDCDYLAKMAALLGRKQEESELLSRHNQFGKITSELWDASSGIYLNKYLDTPRISHRLSPTLWYPMLAGIPDSLQAGRMMMEHYYNASEFYGNYILPSISRNDKDFDNHYWRGCIWPPINFLVYLGLKKYDSSAAADLADKSYKLFMEAWRQQHVYENINSVNGAARREDQLNTDPFYHWGALMGVLKFIEEEKYDTFK